MLSRRALLLSGGALAALAGVSVPAVVLADAAPGFRVFSADELELVGAIGEALFPPGNPLGVSAGEVDLAALVDDLVGDQLDPSVGPLFRYLLRSVEVGTLASRGARFSALPLPDRVDVLHTWADEAVVPRRMLYDALRVVFGMAFLNTPEVVAAIGWQPRCHGGTT